LLAMEDRLAMASQVESIRPGADFVRARDWSLAARAGKAISTVAAAATAPDAIKSAVAEFPAAVADLHAEHTMHRAKDKPGDAGAILAKAQQAREKMRRWAGDDDTKLAADLNHGLTQVGLQANEADQITRYALDLPQRPATQAATPPPSQTELLIRLKSRQKPEGDEAASSAEAGPRKLPLTPSERRALETLKQLPFGSWLEFTVNQQGQRVARKLAWFAPTSGRCLVVNARGAPAPERTLDQLARMMARGQVHLIPRQDGGMIDRAWNALVAGLRKFSRPNATTESAA